MEIKKRKKMHHNRKTHLSFSLFYKINRKTYRLCDNQRVIDVNNLFKCIPESLKNQFEHKDILSCLLNDTTWEREFRISSQKNLDIYISELKIQLKDSLKILLKNRDDFLKLLSNLQKYNNGWSLLPSELEQLYAVCSDLHKLYYYTDRDSLFKLIDKDFSKFNIYKLELSEAMNRTFIMLERGTDEN
jgi:hypothetical protein